MAEQRADNLSPISRRAFFHGLGAKALKLGIVGTAIASLGSDDEGGCRINIRGTYVDYSDANCGYCDADGADYEHCDGEYCDYINYADES